MLRAWFCATTMSWILGLSSDRPFCERNALVASTIFCSRPLTVIDGGVGPVVGGGTGAGVCVGRGFCTAHAPINTSSSKAKRYLKVILMLFFSTRLETDLVFFARGNSRGND